MFSLLHSCTWLCAPALLLVLPASWPDVFKVLQDTQEVFHCACLHHLHLHVFFTNLIKFVSLPSLLFVDIKEENGGGDSPKIGNLHQGLCYSFD